MSRFVPSARIAAAVGLATALAVVVSAQPGPPARDAELFRVVPLAADGIPAALAQVDQGTLVRLAETEFDRLSRPAVKEDPGAALIATRYRGRVTFDGAEPNLIGTGEWVVRSPVAGAEFRLPTALIPVRQARWPDGKDAVLYKAPREDALRLVAPTAGDTSLNLEWSSRGVADPGEVRFELRVPSSPVASLDLELPPGYLPIVPPDDALLTGPFPAERGAAWRLVFGGAGRLTLVLRRVDEARLRLFARLTTVQRLGPGEGTAGYTFQVESAKVGFTDLEFAFDETLTPTEVRVNNLAGWTILPGPGRRLLVRLSEPTRSARLDVAGTFPVPVDPTAWVSPAVTLPDAVSLGEQLQLIVTPGVRFRDWRAGDYRLVRAGRGRDGSYQLDAEPDPVPASRKPAGRPGLVVLRPAEAGWRVDQRAEWTVGLAGEEWVVRNAVEVTAGPVSAIQFRPAAGWVPDRVEVNGIETNADTPVGGPWTVDLGRPVAARELADVTLRFRRGRQPGDGIPFPDLIPVGPVPRTGRLTIRVDNSFDAVPTDPIADVIRAGGPSPTPGTFERVLTADPLVGKLHVRPRATRPTAEVRTVTRPGSARVALTVRPDGGALTAVSYRAGASPLVWRDPQGRRFGHLTRQPIAEAAGAIAGLGQRNALGIVATVAALRPPMGSTWTLEFPRPVTEPTTLTADAPAGDTDVWILGMPFRGVVQGTDGGSRAYGPAPAARDEHVRSRPTFDGLQLLTVVHADGRTEAAFRFRARSLPGQPLPVRLSDGARLVAVMVAGRAVALPSTREIAVPVPATDDWTTVEIRYTGPDLGGGVFVRPVVELPVVDFDTAGVRRVWHISPAWRVFARGPAESVPGTVESTSGLPLPDWRTFVPPGRADGPAVLDTFALAAAGLGVADWRSQTLAEHDLTVAEVDGVAVLTGGADARAWRTDPLVASALSDAIRYGRDASGRFVGVGHADSASVAWPVPAGWGVWASDDPGPGPVLVRRSVFSPVAWGTTLILLLLSLAVRARPRIRWGLILVWAGVAAAGAMIGEDAVAEGSGPMLLAAVAAGLVACLPTVVAAPVERPSRRIAAPAAALILAVGAYAAEPVFVVYRLPAEAGRPATVLAPPKLLDRLRERTTARIAVTVTAAEYTGSRDVSAVRVQARFRVWAFDDKPARLTLPLQAVKLRDVRLDGAEAGGVAVGPDGLTVPVVGRGEHTLDVRFEVPTVGAGPDREVKVSIPEVPVSRLKFDSPRTGPKLRTGAWRGAVRTTAAGESEQVDVDLGSTPTLHLRWPADVSEKGALVRAREAAVWDVRDGAARLESLTELRVVGPGPAEIQLAVPAAAEVYRVAVRSDGTAAGTPARVRAWAVGPSDGSPVRTLTVSFAAPLEGRSVLELEMYATGRWVDRPALHLPRLLKVPDVESHAAFSLAGATESPPGEAVGLAEAPADGFKTVWVALGGTALQPARAYRVTGPAVLTPSIRPPTNLKGAVTDLTWWVADDRIVGRAVSRVPGSTGRGLVEWRLRDGVRVTDVTGPRLFAWAQTGERVQAWFDRPVVDGSVRWAAERPRQAAAGDTTIPVPDFGPGSVTTVCVRPTNGFALSGRGPGETLTPTGPGEVTWRVAGTDAGKVTVWEPQTVTLSVSTNLRRSDAEIEARTTIDLTPLRRDRPHLLAVTVHGPGGPVSVAGPGLIAAEVGSESDGRRWDVFVPAGRTTDVLAVTVRRGDARWALPRVAVQTRPGGPVETTGFRIESGDVALADVTGLTVVGPNEWRADTARWQATATRPAGPAAGTAAGVVGTVQAARTGDRWSYVGTFEVSGPEKVEPSDGMTVVSATVGGVLTASNSGAIFVPSGPGPRAVVVRWTTAGPTWRLPVFRDAAGQWVGGTVDWIVTVPPGLRPAGGDPGGPGPRAGLVDEAAFRDGLPVLFRSTTDTQPAVRLVAAARPWEPVAAAFGLWAGLALLWLWPTRFRPERLGLLGALGGVALGATGAVLWALPAGALLARVGSAFRRAKSVA